MSIQRIQQYYAQVERIKQYGGTSNETSIRKPFQDLLEYYAHQHHLELIAELDYHTRTGRLVRPDGTLKDALRQDWGYWESKDEADNLDTEIAKKFDRGYPQNNILFEDSQTAILFQGAQKVGRVPFQDRPALDQLLTQFVSYESQEVREFREAIERFKQDVPALVAKLRDLIDQQSQENGAYRIVAESFLQMCQQTINPTVTAQDVREMVIQHILTQDIFNTIFGEGQFHQEHHLAQRIGGITKTFYHGAARREIDAKMSGYYLSIKARAAQIYNHHEKQRFLKMIYETFYKAYNPASADRLGIVYTPNEIVRFMIESADTLCEQHFQKTIGDPGVQILDPATGTGTFITELIDYLPTNQLLHKYAHELHANEIAILPYYIANLNIEHSYQQKMGRYVPFSGLVFADTLDNIGFSTQYEKQIDLFSITEENFARLQHQNEQTMTVILGNPPYNASQTNYNDQNANRSYKHIDQRIRQTYAKQGKAQNQIVLYDMYTRFFRWATDRLKEEGIIAFVTNNSFIHALTYDGFRKTVQEEFSHLYVIDLGGNLRNKEQGNVFGIRVGVAISFMVRKKERDNGPCQIHYTRLPETASAKEKLQFLRGKKFRNLTWDMIRPDKNHVWVNQTENDFDQLLPLIDKEVKAGKGGKAIFKLFSSGVKTQRDEWVIDFSPEHLAAKIRYFTDVYNACVDNPNDPDKMSIKWDRELDKYRERRIRKTVDEQQIFPHLHRPFVKSWLYFDKHFNGMTYQNFAFFPNKSSENRMISVGGYGRQAFATLMTKNIPDLNFFGDPAQWLPLHYCDNENNPIENITDWALGQFQGRYGETAPPLLDKQAIFHYVYAVLHHPAYRNKYEQNLKRDFPRIPFYDDFWRWAKWGERLEALHLHYETVLPYPIERQEKEITHGPKAKLKAVPAKGIIEIDNQTSLSGIPSLAWEYKLGNRSALEWVLDRYKERTPQDPTIAKMFNTYRFLDYKEQVIDLLMRVTTVSIETMEILHEMSTG